MTKDLLVGLSIAAAVFGTGIFVGNTTANKSTSEAVDRHWQDVCVMRGLAEWKVIKGREYKAEFTWLNVEPALGLRICNPPPCIRRHCDTQHPWHDFPIPQCNHGNNTNPPCTRQHMDTFYIPMPNVITNWTNQLMLPNGTLTNMTLTDTILFLTNGVSWPIPPPR